METVALPPEIGFLLADGVAYRTLCEAAETARRCRCDAATVLLNAGLVDEERFYCALARALGVPFLDEVRLCSSVGWRQVLEENAGPLGIGSPSLVVAAPRGRQIACLVARRRHLPIVPAITTPTRLRLAVFAQHGGAIACDAAEDLRRHFPEWSCKSAVRPLQLAILIAVLVVVSVAISLPWMPSRLLLGVAQLVTLAMLAVRLGAVLVPPRPDPPAGSRLLGDAALPTYTVLVALYREARIVDQLIASLIALDYPAAKLDIKLLIEADDTQTAAALLRMPLQARFEIVTVPPGLPRTKPRALNVALAMARGEHLVVYDAEDTVDPGQLRLAASLFARAPASTACLQGRLLIDNCEDSWLTRLFAIEYSALFDVLGPALAAWRMPTPLGGTTTHFRTRVLRELHGWDPWNVTEDADLGLRLALAGYRVGDLPSDTREEAPSQVRPWLRQRTRWMKGFLQTGFTHLRRPAETGARLGFLGSLVALTLVPGTVASALVYPFLSLWTAHQLLLGPPVDADLLAAVTQGGTRLVVVGGILAMLLPGLLACRRRERPDLMAWVALLPLYFVLVSAAAWLAVFELARHPYRWNKTEHGLARSSRSGARRALVEAGAPLRSASPAPLRPPVPAFAG